MDDLQNNLLSIVRKAIAFQMLEDDLLELSELIEQHPAFFNNPKLGDKVIATAVLKLRELINGIPDNNNKM